MFVHGRPVCTYVLLWNLCLYLGTDKVCVFVRACSVHPRMVLIPVFFGVQPESQLSPHPALTHKRTHIRVRHQHPSACPRLPSALSSWLSLWVGRAHTYKHANTHTHWGFRGRGGYEALNPNLQMDIPVKGWLVWMTAQQEERVWTRLWKSRLKSWPHASSVFTPPSPSPSHLLPLPPYYFILPYQWLPFSLYSLDSVSLWLIVLPAPTVSATI